MIKLFIAFVICIVAFVPAYGKEHEISDYEKRVNAMVKEADKECTIEMKLKPRITGTDGFLRDDYTIDVEACVKACVDKKMGLLNKDGSYSLEKILSFAETPMIKERAVEKYSGRIKYCSSLVSKEPCKMAACIHGMPECAYIKSEC